MKSTHAFAFALLLAETTPSAEIVILVALRPKIIAKRMTIIPVETRSCGRLPNLSVIAAPNKAPPNWSTDCIPCRVLSVTKLKRK